jgi:hypothetical protein
VPPVAGTAHISQPDVLFVGKLAAKARLLDANVVYHTNGMRGRGLRITAENPLDVGGAVECLTGSAAPRAGRTGLWA